MRSEAILVNGVPSTTIDVMDRGLQYGDGVFRTIKADSGKPRWWKDHYRKLREDCEALGIQCPEEPLLEKEVDWIAARAGVGVVKIIVTRGAGSRGYRIPEQSSPERIVMGFPPSPALPEIVKVRWCDLRLPRQPRLAGVKHLNRLENVLARSEWNDPDIAEGLLMDEAGQVIGGTMSNVFIIEQGRLVTPDLSNCGVAGVARLRILRAAAVHGELAAIETIHPERLVAAEQVLLCNSLIEVWRAGKLGEKAWPDNGWAYKLKCWLNEDD